MTIEEKFKQALAEAWPVGTTFGYKNSFFDDYPIRRAIVTKIIFSIDEYFNNTNLKVVGYRAADLDGGHQISWLISHSGISKSNPTKPEAQ